MEEPGCVVVVKRERCPRSGIWGAARSRWGLRVDEKSVLLCSDLFAGAWVTLSTDLLELSEDPTGRRAERFQILDSEGRPAVAWRPPEDLAAEGMPTVALMDGGWRPVETE